MQIKRSISVILTAVLLCMAILMDVVPTRSA